MLAGLIMAILFGSGLSCLCATIIGASTGRSDASCASLGLYTSIAIEIGMLVFTAYTNLIEPGAEIILLGFLVVAITASILIGQTAFNALASRRADRV